MGLFGRGKKQDSDAPETSGSEGASDLAQGLSALEREDFEIAVPHLERAAAAGEVEAAWHLAMFASAREDEVDLLLWLGRAADLGHPEAMFGSALFAKHGGDEKRHRELLERCIAEHEHDGAMRELGVAEREAGNIPEAMELFHRAAELGNTDAMYDIGIHHEHSGDRITAREWYQRGADLGDEECMRAVGVVDYALGRNDEAEVELRNAAEAGDHESMVRLGQILWQRGEHDEGRELIARAAEAGYGHGIAGLGFIAEQEGDLDEANRLYEQAAEAGSEFAMFNRGNNARRAGDFDTARIWLRKGIDAGFAPAAMLLGKLERGDFVLDLLKPYIESDSAEMPDIDQLTASATDLDAATRWFEKAGELGNPAAYGFLASIALDRADAVAVQRYIHRGLAESAGAFHLINVEEISAQSPDTYEIPPRELRERFTAGEQVKLVWTDGRHTERMWVTILTADEGRYVGMLDNDPVNLEIEHGTITAFGPEHVLERPLTDEERATRVDEAVVSGTGVRDVPDGFSKEKFDELVANAGGGDVEAMLLLAQFHRQNDRNDEAREMLERAAEADSAEAIDLLGDMAREADEVEEAIALWTRAAALGNAASMYSLGWHANEREEEREAEQWWRMGAAAGESNSMAALGALLVKRDAVVAREFLEQAVELRNPSAMVTLSQLEFDDGDEDHARTLLVLAAELGNARAVQILEKRDAYAERRREEAAYQDPDAVAHHEATLETGDEESFYWLWNRALFLEDVEEKERVIRMGARHGSHIAMDLLGDILEQEGEQDQAEAWWTRAAESGNSDSMFSLGLAAYHRGDVEGATAWWDQAIARGNRASAHARAHLAEEQNDPMARTMLERAVEMGSVDAMFDLGIKLYNEGGETEKRRGFDLIVEAARNGHEHAQELLQGDS